MVLFNSIVTNIVTLPIDVSDACKRFVVESFLFVLLHSFLLKIAVDRLFVNSLQQSNIFVKRFYRAQPNLNSNLLPSLSITIEVTREKKTRRNLSMLRREINISPRVTRGFHRVKK